MTFNDVNNDGLNTSQILGPNQKFQVEINGQVDQNDHGQPDAHARVR